MAEPAAQQTGEHERDQHVRREGPETQPNRAVGRHERNHGIDEPDRRERVEHRCHDVHGQECEREQRGAAVHRVENEPRHRGTLHPADVRHAEREAQRQQHQRDRAGSARQIPERTRSCGAPHVTILRTRPEPAQAEPEPAREPKREPEREDAPELAGATRRRSRTTATMTAGSWTGAPPRGSASSTGRRSCSSYCRERHVLRPARVRPRPPPHQRSANG